VLLQIVKPARHINLQYILCCCSAKLLFNLSIYRTFNDYKTVRSDLIDSFAVMRAQIPNRSAATQQQVFIKLMACARTFVFIEMMLVVGAFHGNVINPRFSPGRSANSIILSSTSPYRSTPRKKHTVIFHSKFHQPYASKLLSIPSSKRKKLLLKPVGLFKDDDQNDIYSSNKEGNKSSAAGKDKEDISNMISSWITIASEKQKQILDSWAEKQTLVVDFFLNLLPPQVASFLRETWQKFIDALPTLRTITLSFAAGAVIAICAVIAPIYTMADRFTEPVTLFETILTDLDRGYVDKVDTQKLFETGVTAMLRSLDPYTEFEGKTEAVAMQESVAGKYGGVGLVITGPNSRSMQLGDSESYNLLEEDENDGASSSILLNMNDNDEEDDAVNIQTSPGDNNLKQQINRRIKSQQIKDTVVNKAATKEDRGISVVAAFEGYAFDAGMRVGDRIVSVDAFVIKRDTTVDDVRNLLRGDPGTSVAVSFERDGLQGLQTVNIPRKVVKIHDVKAATMFDNNVAYIELRGFSEDAGREMRAAITSLQRRSEMTSGKELSGLILDLRQNPGGLLTQAVDVASLFVPKGSDIVSARGRGFPSVLYRSRVDPLVDPSKTNVVVLVSGNTASAAEIVSGAIQDLDVGVIMGSDRTFGKGLVQNVESLPFDTALKFTVAKYYTPSGRCIQSTKYVEGGGLNVNDSKFTSMRVKEDEKSDFLTKGGRIVKDGGGIEADVKVKAPKASALEIALLRSNLLNDFAAEWSKSHELTNNHKNFGITGETFNDFQKFVLRKQENKEVDLLSQIYGSTLESLRSALKRSGYKHSLNNELAGLQASILNEMKNDFIKYRSDIKEDLEQAILARYLPESMLIERAIKVDKQVKAAADLLADKPKFDTVLARSDVNGGTSSPSRTAELASGGKMATISYGAFPFEGDKEVGVRLNFKW